MYFNKLKEKIDNIPELNIPAIWKDFYDLDETQGLQSSLKKCLSILDNFDVKDYKKNDKLYMIQLFLQHFTSYIHDSDSNNTDSNILKNILMIPFYKSMGFNSIMLLPHFLRSEKFKKGTKGSPYSVKDYYKVDPSLKDPYTDISAENMFGAFVQACHKGNLKVFIDMVPRTAARDSLWILENPEWFYWIKPENSEKLIDLLHTHVDGIGHCVSMTDKVIDQVVKGLPIKEISELFEFSPNIKDPEKWDDFVKKNKNNPDFLEEIVKEFGIITPPCTSDCVNDPQPPWTDVTPLRLYKDYFIELEREYKEILEKSAPFFIQPILKASNYKGNKKMVDLWEKISEIPSYYKDKYDVDGLRGDMFHALPSELISMMKEKISGDFTLIMENLDNDAGNELSLEHDFDYYTGNLFTVIDEGTESLKYFLNQTSKHKTKVLAMPVIGDSVPVFSKDKIRAYYQIAIPAFFPNSAFGITADTIISNSLPLNYGLGFTKESQAKFDELMKKRGRNLAYFNHDHLTYEWDNYSSEVKDHISNIIKASKNIFKEKNEVKNINVNNDLLYYEIVQKNKKYCVYIYEGNDLRQIMKNGKYIYSFNCDLKENINMNKYSLYIEEVMI